MGLVKTGFKYSILKWDREGKLFFGMLFSGRKYERLTLPAVVRCFG